MMIMPAYPEPTALKLVKANEHGRMPGGRKVPDPVPFDREAPTMPAYLSPEAKREWKRVVPGLMKLKVIKPEDRATLAVYCETWAEFKAASEELKANPEGLMYSAKQGLIPHPAVGVRRAAGKRLQELARDFGMTPAAETKITAEKAIQGDDENPYA